MNTYHTKHAPHAGPPLFSVDLAVLAAARAGGDRGDGVRAAPHAALCIRQARHADEIFLPASVRVARRQLRQYSARDLGGRTRRDGPYRELLRHRLRRPQYHRPDRHRHRHQCRRRANPPAGLALSHDQTPHHLPALLAVAVVAVACHLMAQPVRGMGIALPVFAPILVTAATALLISRRYAAPLAYIAGSMGTLVGAGLVHLGVIRGLGTPVASIGGAGTFDGIFLTSILAVVLAGLLTDRPAARA